MMMKCKFCDKKATRVTAFYRLAEDIEENMKEDEIYWTDHVCRDHYLMFHHGIETIVCPDCNKPTIIEMDYFYDMEDMYCCHCGKLIPPEVD